MNGPNRAILGRLGELHAATFCNTAGQQVDIWTETSEEEEYVEMARRIAEGITVEEESGTNMTTAATATATAQELPDEPGTLYRRATTLFVLVGVVLQTVKAVIP